MADRRYFIPNFNARSIIIATRRFVGHTTKGATISLALSHILALPSLVLAKPLSVPQIFNKIDLSPNFSPDPETAKGIGGGSIPMKNVAQTATTPTGACMGFVDRSPDRRVVLKSFFNYLKIEVKSLEDTTLLIKGPGGIWCNDDYEGKNPGVSGQWLQGNYQIWVGSYKRGEYHPYTLRFTQKP